jgi:CDP-glucose 4,6-dehydratase
MLKTNSQVSKIPSFQSSYKNLRVFITGHSGFKGGWLTLWLKSLGAKVLGYSLEPNTNPSFYEVLNIESQCQNVFGNILDREKLEQTMLEFQPDIVFHLAAQPLVRLSYSEPVNTYETNIIGTLNVLEAAKKCKSIKAFVNITTDKCYENKEINRGYKEDEPMGGYDMYSSSKGCVEIMSSSYRRSFLTNGEPFAMATARAGNVIGGGDWALDRLIPDCVRFINEGKPIEIRNPIAVRPWQHVLEPLSGYLLLGQKLLEDGAKYAEGFNFGPKEESVLTVADVAQRVVNEYQKGKVMIGEKSDLHEAGLLMLNIEKAEKVLNWTPTLTANEAILATVEWYKRFYNGDNMQEFTFSQIEQYTKKMQCKNLSHMKS